MNDRCDECVNSDKDKMLDYLKYRKSFEKKHKPKLAVTESTVTTTPVTTSAQSSTSLTTQEIDQRFSLFNKEVKEQMSSFWR